jgi:hypothetical protein
MPSPKIEEAKPPLCPHCGAALKDLGLYSWQSPNAMILSISCNACQVLLHAQIIPLVSSAGVSADGPVAHIHRPS